MTRRTIPPPEPTGAPRPEISKTERVLNLVSFLLKSRSPVPWSEIREKVIGYRDRADEKTLERRFERDKKELRRIGIPVQYLADDGFGNAGYAIPKDQYFLPAIRLSTEEALLLQYLSQMALSQEKAPLAEHLASALMKFTYDPLDREAAEERERIFGRTPEPRRRRRARTGRLESNLRLLSDAVFENRRVTFSYRSLDRPRAERRRVDPYGIGDREGRWYLVGYSVEREDVRSYRVDRIDGEVKVAQKSHTFRPPEAFRIENSLGKRPWEMAPGQPVKAEVRFHPDIAWMVPDAVRMPGPLREGKDGRGRLRIDVYDPKRFFRWVLKHGDQAEVVSPAALRKSMVEKLRAARDRYRR